MKINKKVLPYLLLIAIIFILMSCSSVKENANGITWTENDRKDLVGGLISSRNSLFQVVDSLTFEQWNFVPDSTSWSIAEIVEHLGLQQDMHFREVYVLSKTPPLPEIGDKVEGNEIKISQYESDTTAGTATWNVEPLGRWCSKEDALNQFNISRDKLIEFVSNTNINLRHHFTFRELPDKTDYRNIRDLHQIVLTTITHTLRHVHQIEELMVHPQFPEEYN